MNVRLMVLETIGAVHCYTRAFWTTSRGSPTLGGNQNKEEDGQREHDEAKQQQHPSVPFQIMNRERSKTKPDSKS
jgi:hypothetical protein